MKTSFQCFSDFKQCLYNYNKNWYMQLMYQLTVLRKWIVEITAKNFQNLKLWEMSSILVLLYKLSNLKMSGKNVISTVEVS